MTTLIRCCVPHCRETKPFTGESIKLLNGETIILDDWMCVGHIKTADADIRRLERAAFQRARVRKTPIAMKVSARVWRRFKRHVIERSGGIT